MGLAENQCCALEILGIVFLIFGFITLVGSLIYCVVLCRENPYPRHPEEFYWTHHWSKTIGPSEIHYSASEKPYRQNGHRYDNGKYSDRESAKGYSDRESKLSRY
ncbi:jg16734 [Pararge aegeria aegeria]|uniref:Jg16734 protein n=1 Tax=Pararge aegeria aegeria TaxID=348720 RepID=A0A8S4S6P6_9NEOP|nr:jg16734 [Pararge aegeria aegeria]